jgi:hypothetical protein
MKDGTRCALSLLIKRHGKDVEDGKENFSSLVAAHGLGSRMATRVAAWVRLYGTQDPLSFPDKVERQVQNWGAKTPPGVNGPAPTEPTAEFTDIDENHISIDIRAQALVMSVEDLIRVSGLDTTQWRIVKHEVNTWTTAMKVEKIVAHRANGDPVSHSEPVVVRNWQVKVSCQRRYDREFRLPKFSTVPRREVGPPRRDGREVALLIPDAQIGFRRHRNGLYPLHDRRALDAAVRAAQLIKPDKIIWLGDNQDLAELSEKFVVPAEMIDTAEPTLAEMRYWLHAFAAAAPWATQVVLEGNHENRLVVKRNKHLAGFANTTAPGDVRPALDMARLLGIDALGAEYVAPYGSDYWLWNLVRVTHGDIVRSKSGQTVSSVVNDSDFSTAFGHIHRVEVAYRTKWGPNGPRQVFAASPGCLCRIVEGVVPGVKMRQNWQQGLGVVSMDMETGQESITLPLIHRGRLWLGEGVVVGEDQTASVEKETGWQMARDWLSDEE